MRLVVRKAGEVITVREIEDEVIYLGRSKKGSIVLSDSCVSRRHAKVYFKEGTVFLEDLESANGTKVKGKRI